MIFFYLFVHYITFLVISSINYLLVSLIQWQEILASSDREDREDREDPLNYRLFARLRLEGGGTD